MAAVRAVVSARRLLTDPPPVGPGWSLVPPRRGDPCPRSPRDPERWYLPIRSDLPRSVALLPDRRDLHCRRRIRLHRPAADRPRRRGIDRRSLVVAPALWSRAQPGGWRCSSRSRRSVSTTAVFCAWTSSKCWLRRLLLWPCGVRSMAVPVHGHGSGCGSVSLSQPRRMPSSQRRWSAACSGWC